MKRHYLIYFVCLLAMSFAGAAVSSRGNGVGAQQEAKAMVGDFARIPPGEFQMGSGSGKADERPTHRVRISQGFELSRYEVAQAQWAAVMGDNPSRFKGPFLPVEQVSWEDAQEFIQRLNARHDGFVYRLPTEAEWEYACRAGTTGDYAGDLEAMAWYGDNSGRQRLNTNELSRSGQEHLLKRLAENAGQTHPIGQKEPNAWGLYDLHGNVWEWCQDWYQEKYYALSPATNPRGPRAGSHRVLRGGGWDAPAADCRAANRWMNEPTYRSSSVGFRLVRTAK